MNLFDRYANTGALKAVHPGEKVCFAAACLLLALFFSSNHVSVAVFLIMSAVLLGRAGVPFRLYGKLVLMPFFFLIPGCLAVALVTLPAAGTAFFVLPFFSPAVGITAQSLALAVTILLRSLAAVFCLYFLALTTPFNDLAWVMRKARTPEAVVELAALTYRFIFVLADTGARIYTAQASRLGFTSAGNAFKSLGGLAAGLYLWAYHRSRLLTFALEARCYHGRFPVLDNGFAPSAGNRLAIAGTVVLLTVMGLVF